MTPLEVSLSADQLGTRLGSTGRWVFLIGAWTAVVSSLLGVWQAVPYLFADVWRRLRPASGTVATATPLTETTAYRLHSKLLDRDFWLCQDRRAARELAAAYPGVPILTFAEVALLEGRSKEDLQAILDAKGEFPESGWIQ